MITDHIWIVHELLGSGTVNWTIDFGVAAVDTNAQAFVVLGTVEVVAPLLLNRVLSRRPKGAERDERNTRPISNDASERRFRPLALCWRCSMTRSILQT
jgi:hypothetical protein